MVTQHSDPTLKRAADAILSHPITSLAGVTDVCSVHSHAMEDMLTTATTQRTASVSSYTSLSVSPKTYAANSDGAGTSVCCVFP